MIFRTTKEKTTMRTKTNSIPMGGGKTVVSLLAATIALGAATTAQAAHTWTGNVDGNINNKNNYSATTYSGYYKASNLTGKKVTTLYLPSNLTGSFKFAGDSTARAGNPSRGIFFFPSRRMLPW